MGSALRYRTDGQGALHKRQHTAIGLWLNRHWGKDGLFTRSWPISITALWIAALLTAYVLVYYI